MNPSQIIHIGVNRILSSFCPPADLNPLCFKLKNKTAVMIPVKLRMTLEKNIFDKREHATRGEFLVMGDRGFGLSISFFDASRPSWGQILNYKIIFVCKIPN
jgi:hypothetical protein